jgi:pantoate--beta-alanine ligase
MQTFTNKAELRDQLLRVRSAGKTIALVPTMGNLHSGHSALLRAARHKSDYVVSTIFVNPLQFADHEDLDDYPRTLEDDQRRLKTEGCDCLFAPGVEEVYGARPDLQTRLHVPGLSEHLCGSSRPGHFDGVATVVCKLLNIVQPDSAFFGLKDYQQFLIIQKLVQDLAMSIEIIGIETQREASGLALSSRNNYLDSGQKQKAALLYRCLLDTAASIRSGDTDFPALEQAARQRLSGAGITADYFSICSATDLQAATAQERALVILTAAVVGPCRLIDNIRVSLID